MHTHNPVPDLFQIIVSRYRFLYRFTAAALAVTALTLLLFPRKYKAEVIFMLRNPEYTDRSGLFGEAKPVAYFAPEEDIARLLAISVADSLQYTAIRVFGLAAAFHTDSTNHTEREQLRKRFRKALTVHRAEYNDIVLQYRDPDAGRAAALANYYVGRLEYAYRDFYTQMRRSAWMVLQQKIRAQDSMIAVLSDSLGRMREQYGIYDLVSPARHNIINSSIQHNDRPDFARGLELVQNVAAAKDETVADRTRNMTIASQMEAGLQASSLPLVQVIRSAQIPYRPEGPHVAVLFLLSGLCACFFGILFVVLQARFNKH